MGDEQSQATAFDEYSLLQRYAFLNAEDLILKSNDWIHRRVERRQFTDTEFATCQFSVDFTLKEDLPVFESAKKGQATYFLPVALLRRWPPLRNFDIRDGKGSSSPLLSSTKNSDVDSATLMGLLPQDELSGKVEDVLRAIPQSSSLDEASGLVEKLTKRVIGHFEGKKQGPKQGDPEFLRWMRIVRCAFSLTSNQMLWVRVSGRTGDRMIVKVRWDEPVFLESRRNVIASSFGFGAHTLRFPIPDLGRRASFHLEFMPPDGSDIISSDFQVSNPLEPLEEKVTLTQAFKEKVAGWLRSSKYPYAVDQSATIRPKATIPRKRSIGEVERWSVPDEGRPHSLNRLSRASFYIRQCRNEFGIAEVGLAPSRGTFLYGSAFATALTAALMWFAQAFVNELADPRHIAPTTTIFVLIPALLSYLFTQSLPHPIVKKMIVGLRFVTRLTTLMPVVAALVLLVSTESAGGEVVTTGNTHAIWVALAIVCSASFVVTLLPLLLPRSRYGESLNPAVDPPMP